MTPDTVDDFEKHVQQLFAGIAPAAGFEDRLVAAVRSQQRLRLTIPAPVKRAAIAAAAMLAVSGVGYYGSRVMMGWRMSAEKYVASAAPVMATAISPSTQPANWDFGGGSNGAQNWSGWNGKQNNMSFSYENPFGSNKAVSNGWQLKNADASYAAASDIDLDEAKRDRAAPSSNEWKNNAFLDLQHGNVLATKSLKSKTVGNNVVGDVDGKRILIPTDELATVIKDRPQASPLAEFNIGGKVAMGNSYYFREPAVDRSAGENNADPAKAKLPSLSPTASPESAFDGKNTYAGGTSVVAGTLTLPIAAAPPPTASGQAVTALAAIDARDDITEPDQQSQQAPATSTPATQPIDDRKIIRTGSMEFEVDRFDTAQMQISKIVGELGGFVGATDSQKLPNGKVRGSISVRVAPERLDTLVLSLRALGDLKSQQITAADITKEYTDLESELAADRAMQDRLLELIHGGKGTIKDLLAAENELGTWRGKIEKAEGMIRYYNGQVALSTLSITLSERDIQTPATAVETETADVGIEADDVEKARASALKAIDDAKGRIVEADLKRYDAGQLAARLVADVPPESAGAVIDQLKLLGKVARLEVHRQQTASDGTNAVTADTPLHTEQKPTRLLISIYNLANVAPRRTTNVSLAATDVESAYNALAATAKSTGGRVVTSNLDRGDPVKATGSLTLEFPPDKFELAITALHAQGDVLKLTLTENPDTQNSTEAKQGLTVQLVSLASVPARETVQQTLAAGDVPGAYQAVLSAISTAHARVQSAQLNEQDRQNITAELELEVPRITEAEFDKSLATAGGTIARTSSQSADAQGTVDSKVQLHLTITSSDHLAPRETTKLQVEVSDVDKSAGDIQAAALSAGGRVLEATVTKDHGKGTARIVLDLPLDKTGEVLQQVRGQGTVRGIDSSRDPQAPSGVMAHGQLFVEFDTPDTIVADQTGPWASVRQGLSTSVTGLLWSLQWVIVGLCLIGPWAGIGWIVWKIKSLMNKSPAVK